jgi:DNA-binding transcriptional MerR regulator
MLAAFHIGELSRRSGVPARTIRYYETAGLLPRPARSPAGYRLYREDHLLDLGFIAQAKGLGLTLQEIRNFMQLRAAGSVPCRDLLLVVRRHLERIDARIEELTRLRQQLTACLESAPAVAGSGRICGIVERLAGPAQTQASTQRNRP